MVAKSTLTGVQLNFDNTNTNNRTQTSTPRAASTPRQILIGAAAFSFALMFALLSSGVLDAPTLLSESQTTQATMLGFMARLEAFLSAADVVEAFATGAVLVVGAVASSVYRVWQSIPAQKPQEIRTGSMPDFESETN